MVSGACRQTNTYVIAFWDPKEGDGVGGRRKRQEGGGEQRAISGHGPLVAMAMTSG